MEYKQIVCPCCNKNVSLPLNQFSRGFDFDYSILINSTEEFFDQVDICPECGYVMLFDNGISDEMREYIKTDEYRNILNDGSLEEGLKKWILYAILTESDENYTEAGIAYTKAYDYMELKDMQPDVRLIEKAASCFLNAAIEDTSLIDAVLAVDAMRRSGDLDGAKGFLDKISNTFEGELADKLIAKERMWISLGSSQKWYLDI